MIRAERWYREAFVRTAQPEWYLETMRDPKTRSIIQRLREWEGSKWWKLISKVEQLLGNLAQSAFRGDIDRGTFESILDALEAYLEVMERRVELADVKGGRFVENWMQKAVSRLQNWLSGFAS